MDLARNQSEPSIVVQKFGGTSVGSIERIQAVAKRVLDTKKAGSQVVVVVSAMAGETNRLIELAQKVSSQPSTRDLDLVVASGEQVSVGLLSMAINDLCRQEKLDCHARPLLAYQLGIKTDGVFSKARIESIDTVGLQELLGEGAIPVIAGFQGVSQRNEITTLGRGGTDTSAVAIAAALNASECEIYTDVDGVYSTDPRLCADARKIEEISFEEMMELAGLGAKVLQIRCVELAANYALQIHVRSSFNQSPGTKVIPMNQLKTSMEKLKLAGVASDQNQVKFTIKKIPNQLDADATIFQALAECHIVVDVIVKESPENDHFTLSFTASQEDARKARETLESLQADRYPEIEIQEEKNLAKVSIVGVGMQHHPGVAAKAFRILAEQEIPIRLVSTSEIKISCMIPGECVKTAVQALHRGFNLHQSE